MKIRRSRQGCDRDCPITGGKSDDGADDSVGGVSPRNPLADISFVEMGYWMMATHQDGRAILALMMHSHARNSWLRWNDISTWPP